MKKLLSILMLIIFAIGCTDLNAWRGGYGRGWRGWGGFGLGFGIGGYPYYGGYYGYPYYGGYYGYRPGFYFSI